MTCHNFLFKFIQDLHCNGVLHDGCQNRANTKVACKYIVFEGQSYPILMVIVDNLFGRSKYTTYINEWMTRQPLVNVEYYNYYYIISLTIGYLECIILQKKIYT